ncbi:THxN family PEP-CTERM protein [uncultured Thiohalocapsa sp.]|uniref:THxN family PEP-CTERM protein n=1 Tax=uncultured Thiohalocapsa sp. TaxID=768990 RepID=UPI0025F9D4EA|nr:THxN family PEP-CTERM protein [uncultured Thiohalocapsa sp.]
MKLMQPALVAAALLPLAGTASAATITMTVLETRFDNPSGGNVLTIDDVFVPDAAPAQIRWGQGALAGDLANASGYEFDPRDTPFSEPEETIFELGNFTHFNFPISLGTSIDSVELFLRAMITVEDGGEVFDLGQSIFEFAVMHDETPNNAVPCPYGDDDDNANGCADQVIIETLTTSDTFAFNGRELTLEILGFSETLQDAQDGIFDSEFISPERGENVRILSAAFATVSEGETPVPAPLLLMAAGLFGLFGAQYLRRRG